jgi:hypothetical protein
MTSPLEEYKNRVINDISTCVEEMGCQPILFVGSGMSKRYFQAPNWLELLGAMSNECPNIKKEFAYYTQSHNNLIEIGDIFADAFKEWAWEDGREQFKDELFSSDMPPEIYFKTKIAEHLINLTPKNINEIQNVEVQEEINLIQSIRPHAVITTNYDTFLELIFPDFTPIIGQSVLKNNYASVGEIYKIHGCVTEPSSIVITSKDYSHFTEKKKYLSAKLLTYFAEHPLVFMGYRASDPNIQAILADIDELISTNNQLIPNIYMIKWDKNLSEISKPPSEEIISIAQNRNVRIKSVSAKNYNWVLQAFGSNPSIQKVNVKLLRAIQARTYDLVRYDLPRKELQINLDSLEHTLSNQEEFAKIYGITTLDGFSSSSFTHKYSLTEIGENLGFQSWHNANKLMEKVKEEKGVDIKSFDNKYHIKIQLRSSSHHKYSDSFFELLKKVRDGEDYVVDISPTMSEQNND